MQRSRSDDLETLLPVVGRVCVARRDYQQAEQLAKRLHAHNPVGVVADCLLARIALAKGDAEGAVRILSRGVNVRNPEATGLLPKAELALGQAADALVDAKAANADSIYPNTEWLLLQAEATDAAGRTDEARELYKRCLELGGPATRVGKQAAERLGSH